jgi:hypothetical protein
MEAWHTGSVTLLRLQQYCVLIRQLEQLIKHHIKVETKRRYILRNIFSLGDEYEDGCLVGYYFG